MRMQGNSNIDEKSKNVFAIRSSEIQVNAFRFSKKIPFLTIR